MGLESLPSSVSSRRHDLLVRLRRAEGQVRGLQRQVTEDAPCLEVLTQIQATSRALEGVALLLLDEYLRTCAAEDPMRRSDDVATCVEEASRAVRRLVADDA